MPTRIEKLNAERTKLCLRHERMLRELHAGSKRIDEIEEAIEKEQRSSTARDLRSSFLELVDVEGGVELNRQLVTGLRGAELNGLRGTLKKVRRTIALVDFGGAGISPNSKKGVWNVRLSMLQQALPREEAK
jgi:hypothetical protein